MMGLSSAWAMASRRPKEYHRKVDAAQYTQFMQNINWTVFSHIIVFLYRITKAYSIRYGERDLSGWLDVIHCPPRRSLAIDRPVRSPITILAARVQISTIKRIFNLSNIQFSINHRSVISATLLYNVTNCARDNYNQNYSINSALQCMISQSPLNRDFLHTWCTATTSDNVCTNAR